MSPHYAGRWGRDWLDAARYVKFGGGTVNGLWENFFGTRLLWLPRRRDGERLPRLQGRLRAVPSPDGGAWLEKRRGRGAPEKPDAGGMTGRALLYGVEPLNPAALLGAIFVLVLLALRRPGVRFVPSSGKLTTRRRFPGG